MAVATTNLLPSVAAEPPRPRSLQTPRPPLALVAAIIAALTAIAITCDLAAHKALEGTRLQAIADLKSAQISDWLKERQSDADLLRGDDALAESYRRWRQHGDSASREYLLDRLEHFRSGKGYRSVLLLDGKGIPLWHSTSYGNPLEPRQVEAARRLATAGQTVLSAPYRDATGGLHLDFVTMLPTAGEMPAATLVVGADPATHLFPLLQTWPVPSASAETLLFRRDADQVLYLNALRHRSDAAANLRAPLAAEKLLAAQVLSGDTIQNSLLEGVDYRGVAVLGVARSVPGTDWFLVAKVNRAEIFATAWRDSLRTALAGLASLLMIWAGAVMLRPPRSMAETRRERERLAEHETIFNNALVGIAYLKHRRVVSCNRRLEEIFGYGPGELIGASSAVFYDTRQTYESVGEDAYRVAAATHHYRTELRLKHRDGSLFYGELNGCVIDPAKPQEGSIWIYYDISERKQVERELEEQKAHLEELVATRTVDLSKALEAAKLAERTKDAFLANISHELRSPLNAVIGMAELARNMSTDARQRNYLDKVTNSGKHLNRIINDLLDLSKIAAGHLEFECISFSLRGLIGQCVSALAQRAEKKGLELVATIDPAVPDVLRGDPLRIEQILLNLIGNAIKFTASGRVEVGVGLHAREEHRIGLTLEVADTGVGIGADELGRLFQPFAQANAAVSRKFGGTGLGLAISRHLAEMMDGDIAVSSREGHGTRFKVSLWLGVGAAGDLPVDAAATSAGPVRYHDARVLVADDQPLNREIVEALLTAVGIHARMAENGQQALDILRECGADGFDLVLMDIQMPVMDGHLATRQLRDLPGFEALPIVAMTAHTMAHEQQLYKDAGMNDHIGKPFDSARFYRTLAKWIPLDKQKAAQALTELPAPAEPPTTTENALGSLGEIDVTTALGYFGGNEARYRHWLTEFVATAGAVPDQIRREIAAGQSDQAGKTAHAFKGSVGLLGMTELHHLTAALESALGEASPADELLLRVERSIKQLRNELARVLDIAIPGDKACAPAAAAGDPQLMQRVVWSDAYSVRVTEMDRQHKKLVGMINQLVDGQAAPAAARDGAFHHVLSEMFDYTQVHFKAEERYMQKIGYPHLAAHEVEHAAFVEKMASFSMVASDGVNNMAEVHGYLKQWLLSHILHSDMQYRHFVEASNIRPVSRAGRAMHCE